MGVTAGCPPSLAFTKHGTRAGCPKRGHALPPRPAAMDARALRIQSSRTACSRAPAAGPRPAHPSPRASPASCSSPPLSPPPCSAARHRRHARCVLARAEAKPDADAVDPEDPNPVTFTHKEGDNRSMLLKFVTEVEPTVVDTFDRTAPQQVVEAVRVTVSSLLGSLPAQFFEVNIVTLGDNLRSLMYSFLMTGYLYRHISDKLDLQGGVARSLPGGVLADDLPQDTRAPGRRRGRHAEPLYGYAEGAGTEDVDGNVTRWHHQRGLEEVEAAEYISTLEKEIRVLRTKLAESKEDDDDEPNDLIKYMRKAPQTRMHQVRAGPDVSEAMEVFLHRLLGSDDQAELNSMVSETTGSELQRVLSWILVVGYTLRGMEVRFSMEQSFTMPYATLEDNSLRDNL